MAYQDNSYWTDVNIAYLGPGATLHSWGFCYADFPYSERYFNDSRLLNRSPFTIIPDNVTNLATNIPNCVILALIYPFFANELLAAFK